MKLFRSERLDFALTCGLGAGTFRLWAAALTKVSLTKLFEIHR